MSFLRDFLVSVFLSCKAKLVALAAGLVLVVLCVSLLSSYFGVRQPSTVALDVGFSAMRILVPLLIVLLAQELFSREFERRYYLRSLTYPRGRCAFLMGRFAAILMFLLVVLFVLSLVQMVIVKLINNFHSQATPVALGEYYLVAMAFMALDFFVLASLATFLAILASTPSFVLIGTFGFMLVARSYAGIVELIVRDAGVVASAEGYRIGLGALGYLLPDLGSLDVRMLALYGKIEFLPADWPWLLASSLGYAFGLLALAVWALQRKRFA